jgi:FkbM family methyltransferase
VHAESRFSVPVVGPGPHVWLTWRPNWKAELIARVLEDRHGAFIDVGANVGHTLLDFLWCRTSCPYVGFEPNAECAGFLQQLIFENTLANCAVVPVGLADRAAVVKLFVPLGDSSSGTMLAKLRPGRPEREIFVSCVPFDDVWQTMGNPPISLVKIDVEGAELEVLTGMSGALSEQRPPVLCEVLHADARADLDAYAERTRALSRLLADADYLAYRVVKQGSSYAGLERVDGFPVWRWDQLRAEACDYLFIHRSADSPAAP